MTSLTLSEFLLDRIEDMERTAGALLRDLEGEVAEGYADAVDERGPMTPARLLSAKMWAHYPGDSKRRSFARGQQIATLANPASHLAECQAYRAIVTSYESAEAARAGMSAVNEPGQKLVTAGMASGLQIALKMLASLHHDHPDYRPEWGEL